MNQSDNRFFLNFNQIRLLTAVSSLVLSVLAFYFNDIINRDGVMYMEMVEAYLDGGLQAMASIYDWPFFTMLVAWFSKGLSLPTELAASGLNCILFVIFTDALLLISRRILPNLQQVTIAGILILCFYSINEYRDYIIRDIGYWAFSTLALYQLIQYLDKPGLKYALLWQVCAMVALLFRIEGMVLLLVLPLFVLFSQPTRAGLTKLLQLNSLLIPVTLIVSTAALTATGWVEAFDKLSNYLAYLNTEALQQQLEQRLTILEEKVLHPFSAEYSGLILFSGLFVMLLYKLLEGLSIGYTLLLILAWWQVQETVTSRHLGLIFWFVLINLVILMAFTFKQYFVVSRYCIMAIIGLFLLILPYLTKLIAQSWQQHRYWLTGFIGFVVLAGVIDTFHTTNSKTYIKDTAIWASHNLDNSDKILTDDEFLQYYLKREQTPVSISYRRQGLGNYRAFDYLLLVEKHRSLQVKPIKGIELELVYQRENRRGNKASVYRVIRQVNDAS